MTLDTRLLPPNLLRKGSSKPQPLAQCLDFGKKITSAQITVLPTNNQEANEFFKKYHYLKRARRSKKICYAVHLDGFPIGFLEFSYPIWSHHNGIIPPYKPGEVVELSRVCLIDNAPKNSESCAISKCLQRLKDDWINLTKINPRFVISYSDREHGHQGGIYKAANFQLIAISHAKKRPKSPHHPNPYSTDAKKLLFGRTL